MDQPSITVGTIVEGAASLHSVYVDGQYVSAPNMTGLQLQAGQSVTVLRMGNGRYQVLGYSGYFAPQPPA